MWRTDASTHRQDLEVSRVNSCSSLYSLSTHTVELMSNECSVYRQHNSIRHTSRYLKTLSEWRHGDTVDRSDWSVESSWRCTARSSDHVLFLRAYVAMVTGRRAVQSCVAEATISVSNTTGKLALLAKARLASVCTADLGYISVNELTSNRPMHWIRWFIYDIIYIIIK